MRSPTPTAEWMAAPTFIYKVESVLDRRCYIGVAKSPHRRLMQHAKAASPLGEAIRAQRLENFSLSILFAGDAAECYKREASLIASYRAEFNVQHSSVHLRREIDLSTQPPVDRHPGAFIRETLLPAYGLSVAETARRLGVDRAGFHQTLKGRYDVSRDLAYKLGALMRDDVADFLISYQAAFDLARERDRRESYRRTIERMAPVAAAGQ